MKVKQINGLLLGALIASIGLPASADSGGVGTNFLMSRTALDPNANSTTGKSKGQRRFLAQTKAGNVNNQGANSLEFPTQILKTGVSLTATGLSANSMQLSENIGLSPVLERISTLRDRASKLGSEQTIESLSVKQDLLDETLAARMIVQKASLEIDFTVAEIEAERQVYNELLSTFKNDRDKALARTNAFAFISNGILWAVTGALFIPPYKHPVYNIPAGIVGIPAGLVPSIASMYTFKQINGKKRDSEEEPNMLAKVFNYPTNPEIEYPNSVWTYLNQVPQDGSTSKKRIDQMIERWIADSNIPAFNDKNSKKQLDVITASASQKKSLTIATLTARSVMLDQLLAEVNKMKRMLLELDMVAVGDKRFIANEIKPSTF